MLRRFTGQNTQQHIHHRLIEKAKEILTTTNLNISEIAYQLGFEYSQSFSKLFKSKTNIGKTGKIDHPILVQIDHLFRSKLTTTFQSKLTT